MDLQFPKTPCSYLVDVGGAEKTLEQTLELKLSDDMPDIGKVLCLFGQAVIRSKQWNRDSVGLTGGVMVWAMYQPEDGSGIRSVEGWIPFQARWDIPEQEHDGVILASCYLQAMDGRSLSARKLMARANVTLCCRAMSQKQVDICQSEGVQEDVQLRKQDCSVLLPREAGEKMLSLEETITAPAGSAPKKLLHYCLKPQVADCKLMADRAVFRGSAQGHVLYRCEDGSIRTWELDLPFSQYTELEREYGEEARLQVNVLPTGLEMELGEDSSLHIKASMIGQYLVFDNQNFQVATDAYSPDREVKAELTQLELPQVTDLIKMELHADGSNAGPGVMDWGFSLNTPQIREEAGVLTAQLAGAWQHMTEDGDGNVTAQSVPWQESRELGAGEQARLFAWQSQQSTPDQAQIALQGYAQEMLTLPMVTGLSMGKEKEKDEDRPGVVLRRYGDQSLWELAKQYATTQEKILDANGLTGEPEQGSWLLIPVP